MLTPYQITWIDEISSLYILSCVEYSIRRLGSRWEAL